MACSNASSSFLIWRLPRWRWMKTEESLLLTQQIAAYTSYLWTQVSSAFRNFDCQWTFVSDKGWRAWNRGHPRQWRSILEWDHPIGYWAIVPYRFLLSLLLIEILFADCFGLCDFDKWSKTLINIYLTGWLIPPSPLPFKNDVDSAAMCMPLISCEFSKCQ